MPRLSRDTLLSIHLGALLSQNRYTKDPAPVIAELIATAGDQLDLITGPTTPTPVRSRASLPDPADRHDLRPSPIFPFEVTLLRGAT